MYSGRIPLHHNKRMDEPHHKRLQERYELWLAMTSANPSGFREAPTSPKNPRTRSNKPETMLEALASHIA